VTRARRALVTTLAFAAGAVAALPLGLHWGGGATLVSAELSPDGRERLELYRPTRWQRLTGAGEHDYAVARLSRTADGAALATSDPFYLDGAGRTRWGPDRVDVGAAASFDRGTSSWSVE
jgi:hypothetical protein